MIKQSKEKQTKVVASTRVEPWKMAGLAKLAKDNGRDVSEQLDFLITEALIAAGLVAEEEQRVHRLRESLIRQYLGMAVQIQESEGHRDDITAETARRVTQLTDWKTDYDTYLSLRDKNTINPTFGRRTNLRLGLMTGKVYDVPRPSIFSTSSYLLQPAEAEAVTGTAAGAEPHPQA
jgi:hypothetical protein